MQPSGVLETCLYVDDLEAAEKFYREVCGLKLVSKLEPRHLFFRCGQAMLLLFNPDECDDPDGDVPPHGARGAGHIAFAVTEDEIPLWRERLAEHNIEIELDHAWERGGHSLYFRDPAGNSLELATPSLWGF